MRAIVKALLVAGVVAIPTLGTVASAPAADLSLQRPHHAVVHHRKAAAHVRYRSRLVRDLDGTPIMLRRVDSVSPNYDGVARYEAIPVQGASPSYYSNGQSVLPHCPRFWPRSSCSRV